jgi:hypothetical protein
MDQTPPMKWEWLRAAVVLFVILNVVFFPFLWGGKTLLNSAWNAPSIMPSGAYHRSTLPSHYGPTPDPGAPAWQTEPWITVIGEQYWHEGQPPLWNSYSGYGKPLAAAMQPQPYYPLFALLSIHPSPWTFNLFVIARLFVAGFSMYLFARLFLGQPASLFSAITFMLTGYFILLLAMPHLSVEVLLPVVFLAVELLLRETSPRSIIAVASSIFLCVIGGMPESLALIVAFACLYFLFRLFTAPRFCKWRLQCSGQFALGLAIGFGLSAVQLLPFLEFMGNGHDTHQLANVGGSRRGLAADGDWRSTIMYLLPAVFGPLGGGWVGMGYWGVIPVVFGLFAVICAVSRRPYTFSDPIQSLTLFFAACLVAMLLKRFGQPIVQWIGYLPIAEQIIFVKYQEPLMAFCIAILAGIGVSQFAWRPSSRWYVVLSATIIVVFIGVTGFLAPNVSGRFARSVFYGSLAAAVMVIGALLLLVFVVPRYYRFKSSVVWGVVTLLSLEMFGNYILPNYYIFNTLPSGSEYNPFRGAPYIDVLRRSGFYRVFARDGVLYPNWAGAFHLSDVRDLDAMYYRRYRDFIRNFLLKPGDQARRYGELADRFTGSGDGYSYSFDSYTERRFLELSSIKYLAGTTELGVDLHVISDFIDQHRGENLWGFGRNEFPVGQGRFAAGVFQHPPSSRVSYKTVIDPARPVLEGVSSIKADAQDRSDGVGFRIELKSGDKIEQLFSTILNPRDVPSDRFAKLVPGSKRSTRAKFMFTNFSSRFLVQLFSTASKFWQTRMFYSASRRPRSTLNSEFCCPRNRSRPMCELMSSVYLRRHRRATPRFVSGIIDHSMSRSKPKRKRRRC